MREDGRTVGRTEMTKSTDSFRDLTRTRLKFLTENFIFYVVYKTIQTHLELHISCLIILPDFNQIWSLSTDFGMKFHENQAGATSIPADKQTDELTERHDEVHRRSSISI
jgi:hypothetical protein